MSKENNHPIENNGNTTERGRIKNILPVIIILAVQVIMITLIFAFVKQGFHADEISNYAFANSYDQTHIWGSENLNRWIDGSEYLEFITVEPEHRFAYASIYRNASEDLNPPFQYFILHTICSLFPGVYSPWFCFLINIAAFVFTQIYLFKLTKSITNSEKAGLATIILFGFGFGAIDITIYLRIYALAVTFAVMLVYYSQLLYANRKTKEKRYFYLGMIFVSCFLGSFTLHLYLVFAFGIVLIYVLYYLLSKQFKLFFQYGLTALTAVLMSMLVFPATYRHVFLPVENYTYSGYAVKIYPVAWQFRLFWFFLTRDLFGVSVSPWPNKNLVYCGITTGVIVFFLIPVIFISRNEKWLHKLWAYVKKICIDLWHKLKQFQITIAAIAGCVVLSIFIAANRTSVPAMGKYANRYIFLLYPIMAAFAVCIVYFPIKWIVKNIRVRSYIIIMLSVVFAFLSFSMGWLNTNQPYFFRHSQGPVSLKDLDADANCIILATEQCHIEYYVTELKDINAVYFTLPDNYKECDYSVGFDQTKPLYLIIEEYFLPIVNKDYESSEDREFQIDSDSASATVKGEDNTEILKFFYSKEFADSIEYVGMDEVYGRKVQIYHINR